MRTFHPSQPSVGNNVSATLIRQLIAEIRASRVIPGPGVTVRRTPQGTHVSATRSFPASEKTDALAPWTFVCTEDPTTHKRTGGWYRQIVQIGLDVYNNANPKSGFDDQTECADGYYYLKVDLKNFGKDRVSIVRTDSPTPEFEDRPNGVLAVYIGEVEEGKQTSGIYWSPIVYHYL